MKMYIPEVGDDLILTEDWSFQLVLERRNMGLLAMTFPDYDYSNYSFYDWVAEEIWPESEGQIMMSNKLKKERRDVDTVDLWNNKQKQEDLKYFYKDNKKFLVLGHEMPNFTLPKGTELKLARIYIKSKGNKYSSLSFWAKLPNVKKKVRFFAPLKDVNNIEYEKK